MSSPDGFNADSLFLVVQPSKRHLTLNLLVFAGAMFVLLDHPLFAAGPRAALGVALLASAAWFLHQFVCRTSAFAVMELTWRSGSWNLLFADGVYAPGQPARSLYAGRWFVILWFRSRGRRIPVVIGRDACDGHSYRRLLVLARHHSAGLLGNVNRTAAG